MAADKPTISRRAMLKLAGGVAVGSAGAAVPTMGCASLPRKGRKATKHPCTHRFCRYHQFKDEVGYCTLVLRATGGYP